MPRQIIRAIFAATPLIAALHPAVAHAELEVTAVDQIGGALFDNVAVMAVDGSGNVFIAGNFEGATSIDGQAFTSSGSMDLYLAKVRPSGAYEWIRTVGGLGHDAVSDLAVGPSGNVVLVGISDDDITFGSTTLVNVDSFDMWTVKVDSDGFVSWAYGAGGLGNDLFLSVDIASTGDVLMGGRFSDAVDFGDGLMTTNGGQDIALVSLDAGGSLNWAQTFGGMGTDTNARVAFDSNDHAILAAGFEDSVDFGTGALTSLGSSDLAIAKYDGATGAALWSQAYGGVGYVVPQDVVTGPAGSIFATGLFTESADLGGAAMTSAGSNDVFVAAYDLNGNHAWSTCFGGPDTEFSHAIALAHQRIAVVGSFMGTADIGDWELTSSGLRDAFLLELDLFGDERCVEAYGGLADDTALTTAIIDGAILCGGLFESTIQLGDFTLTSAGEWDGFLMRLEDVIVSVPGNAPLATIRPAFPNPFRASTTLEYALPGDAPITLDIFDAGGRLVFSEVLAPDGRATWDGRRMDGTAAPSGMYIARIRRDSESVIRRVTLVR